MSFSNRFIRARALLIKSIALSLTVTGLTTGCTMPRYAVKLDDVLLQKGKNNTVSYGYRCTRGAHRGASEIHKENTAAALLAANEDSRFAFIEFDVQYSKDDRIVIFHDRKMFRLFGTMRSIGNMTFSDLSDLTHGEIAAYDEVIGSLTKKLNIEIKSQGNQEEDEKLVDEVIADLRKRKRIDEVLISSISSDVVKYVNETYPDIPTGQIFWLTSSTYLHIDRWTEKLYEEITETEADYLMLHNANMSNIDDLLRLKPKRKTIVFWAFDDTMHIVHKDFSDRLWGDSGFRTFCRYLRFKLASPFR